MMHHILKSEPKHNINTKKKIFLSCSCTPFPVTLSYLSFRPPVRVDCTSGLPSPATPLHSLLHLPQWLLLHCLVEAVCSKCPGSQQCPGFPLSFLAGPYQSLTTWSVTDANSSILAWRISWTEKSGRFTGSQSQTQLEQLSLHALTGESVLPENLPTPVTSGSPVPMMLRLPWETSFCVTHLSTCCPPWNS